MTRTFDLSSRTDHPAPLDVIADLHRRAGELGLRWVLIGAAARDLVAHLPSGHPVVRATNDVDIAIAVEGRQQFLKFTEGFSSARGQNTRFSCVALRSTSFPSGVSNPAIRSRSPMATNSMSSGSERRPQHRTR